MSFRHIFFVFTWVLLYIATVILTCLYYYGSLTASASSRSVTPLAIALTIFFPTTFFSTVFMFRFAWLLKHPNAFRPTVILIGPVLTVALAFFVGNQLQYPITILIGLIIFQALATLIIFTITRNSEPAALLTTHDGHGSSDAANSATRLSTLLDARGPHRIDAVLKLLIDMQSSAGDIELASHILGQRIYNDERPARAVWEYIESSPLWRKRLEEMRLALNLEIWRLHLADSGESESGEFLPERSLAGLRFSPKNSRRQSPLGLPYLLKFGLDRITATILLVVMSPIVLTLAIALAVELGTCRVLYKTRRLGRYGKPFDYIRFRYTKNGDLLYLGRFLLWTGLGRIPALLNIARGDMSLVGPGAVYISDLIISARSGTSTALWEEYLSVNPGLLGASLLLSYHWEGHTGITEDDLVLADIAYIRSWSLWGDIKIILSAGLIFFRVFVPASILSQIWPQEIAPVSQYRPTGPGYGDKSDYTEAS